MSVARTKKRLEQLQSMLTKTEAVQPPTPPVVSTATTPQQLRQLFALHRHWVAWYYALPSPALNLVTANMAAALQHAWKKDAAAADQKGWDAAKYAAFLDTVPDDTLRKFADTVHLRTGGAAAPVPTLRVEAGKRWFPTPEPAWCRYMCPAASM